MDSLSLEMNSVSTDTSSSEVRVSVKLSGRSTAQSFRITLNITPRLSSSCEKMGQSLPSYREHFWDFERYHTPLEREKTLMCPY